MFFFFFCPHFIHEKTEYVAQDFTMMSMEEEGTIFIKFAPFCVIDTNFDNHF
jgi:hypothetical protein